MVKVLTFIKRKSGMPVDEFQIVTEDVVTKDGALGAQALKGVEFFTKKADFSVEDFQRHWRDKHAALAAKVPGLQRYVVSATRSSAYAAPTFLSTPQPPFLMTREHVIVP